MSLWNLFILGGLVMWPILLCSIIGIYIIIERYLVLKKAQANVNQFMLNLKVLLRKNDIRNAIDLCDTIKVPVSRILRQGILRYNRGHKVISEAVENAGSEEIYNLETGLSILATIAGIAPLLGFLGTVTGIIAAFQTIQNAGGVVSPSDLAGGIWEALLTTAFGLFVGIPAYFFYNYFVNRIKRFVFEIQSASNEFLDLIQLENEDPEQQSFPASAEKFEPINIQ
jgi:biopolymer transport protein ExbB